MKIVSFYMASKAVITMTTSNDDEYDKLIEAINLDCFAVNDSIIFTRHIEFIKTEDAKDA